MELDFKSVKALSSPTRVKILKQVMEKEATTTRLSDDLGKSKSTISSHLEKLQEAGLVEKDEEEGRKRVVYSPTRKADAIVKGKERRVKFTLASSVVSMFAGIALVFGGLSRFGAVKQKAAEPEAAMMAMDAAEGAAEESSRSLLSPDILLFLGVGMLGVSVFGFLYGITVRKLQGGL